MAARYLLCVFLISMLFSCTDSKPANNNKSARTALVTLAEAQHQDVPFTVEAVGTVTASSTVRLVSRTSGELRSVLVKDGQQVQKGQLLFVIEKEPYEIALHQAQARLESDRAKLAKARDDYARAQKMSKGGFSSAAETDASKVTLIATQATVREDEASLEKAQLDLSYCEIRAPMDGRAGNVQVDPGNVLSAQTVLLVLDAVSPAHITFSVPEKYLPRVRQRLSENSLNLSAHTKEGTPLTGNVFFMDNVDPGTGTVLLKAGFANKDKLLWPGEFLRVQLQLDTRVNAVTVPSRAVMLGPDGPFVYVVDSDMAAHIRLVTTDVEHQGVTVISKGLNSGERVVLEGHVRLKDGMKVRIAEPHEQKAGLAQ